MCHVHISHEKFSLLLAGMGARSCWGTLSKSTVTWPPYLYPQIQQLLETEPGHTSVISQFFYCHGLFSSPRGSANPFRPSTCISRSESVHQGTSSARRCRLPSADAWPAYHTWKNSQNVIRLFYVVDSTRFNDSTLALHMCTWASASLLKTVESHHWSHQSLCLLSI